MPKGPGIAPGPFLCGERREYLLTSRRRRRISEWVPPTTFTGNDVGVSGTVTKSVGDLVDNQLWEDSVPGYQTTTGYDATTGWGTPEAPAFVSTLSTMP